MSESEPFAHLIATDPTFRKIMERICLPSLELDDVEDLFARAKRIEYFRKQALSKR